MAHEVYGLQDSYTYLLLIYFDASPAQGIRHFILIAVAWLHGAIGLHFWLRLKAWYPPLQPYALAAALLLPSIAALGLVDAARMSPAWPRHPSGPPGSWPRPSCRDKRSSPSSSGWSGAHGRLHSPARADPAGPPGQAPARARPRARGGRLPQRPHRLGDFRNHHPRGQPRRRYPHASVCGGRGRCSTCRVRVGKGLALLPAADDQERKVLEASRRRRQHPPWPARPGRSATSR